MESKNEEINSIKKSKKKIKKKIKNNYKDLKDLLNNIKEEKENKIINTKIKKNIKNKKDTINAENNKNNIDEKKIGDNKNNLKSNLKIDSSTTSCSFYQEENNVIQKENLESQTKKETNKFKRMNYISKNNNNINVVKNIDEENIAKIHSPIFYFYKEVKQNLNKMKSIVDLTNSINFVEKKLFLLLNLFLIIINL